MSKILVIDDNEDNAYVLAYLLTDEGHQVSTVHNTSTINQTIAKVMPALILMDVHLGKVDGRDICKSIKIDSATQHIKVILMSALLNVFDPLKNDSCADGFFPKPFDVNEVVELVNRLLENGE